MALALRLRTDGTDRREPNSPADGGPNGPIRSILAP